MIGFILSVAGALAVPVQDTGFAIAAVRTATPPSIDGRVDSTEWRSAARVSGFRQYLPRRGEPASAATEVLVQYDSTALYVAFIVHDPEPITAQLLRRDAELFEDDAVEILVDSHHDRRSAYYFLTNALGTQGDGRVVDDGRSSDGTWDASWRSAARRTDTGWSAEFAIPFAALSFKAGADRTWGMNFGVSRRRTLERSYWAGPLDNSHRVSQAGRLTGLTLRAPSKRYQVVPYTLETSATGAKSRLEAGIDARYAVTPSLSLIAALNPDFATIETDREQVNLTRFEVALPEKRLFFQEGNELYNQRIRTFYSRRIADIEGGAKLQGRQGPWTVAALFADARASGAVPAASYAVTRLQRDVFGRSSVALTVADRNAAGDHRGSVSSDATLYFTKTLSMTAQAVESYGLFQSGSHALFLRPSYDTPSGHFHLRYTELGEHFGDNANAVGLVRDDDRREADSALERTFRFASGALEQVEYSSNYNIYWSRETGRRRSWEVRQGIDAEFRNRWTLELNHVSDQQRFEKDFRNYRTEVGVGYNMREFQSASMGVEWGRNFDSDFTLVSGSARLKPTESLSFEYSLERLQLDPDPDEESTFIHVGRINQFFTKDLFLRVAFQTSSRIDRRELQAVFVYRYRPPFGTLQLAFERGTAGFGERSGQGNTVFLKATYVF